MLNIIAIYSHLLLTVLMLPSKTHLYAHRHANVLIIIQTSRTHETSAISQTALSPYFSLSLFCSLSLFQWFLSFHVLSLTLSLAENSSTKKNTYEYLRNARKCSPSSSNNEDASVGDVPTRKSEDTFQFFKSDSVEINLRKSLI